MKKYIESALWYNENDNELLLIARGSGENIYEDDCGLPKNAPKFYGLNARKLWSEWCCCDCDSDEFYAKLSKKLSKKYPFLADRDNIEDKWQEYRDKNVKEYDCETYALLFDLDTIKLIAKKGKVSKKSQAEHDAVVDAVKNASKHSFDIYPAGVSIGDLGLHIDEGEAMADGGLQTTFEDETPAVNSRKQLKESVQMCGLVFPDSDASKKYLADFKVVATN